LYVAIVSDESSDSSRIRTAADRARARPPVSGDPRFDAVGHAGTGTPALVTGPDGAAAFWLVPYDIDGRAPGMARVSLDASRVDVSVFGGATDRAAWLDTSFFSVPPENLLRAVEAAHPGTRWQAPRLSYDGSPHKWGWRLDADPRGGLVVFLTPGGWYAARSAGDPGREG
jgi:hypothetical protein